MYGVPPMLVWPLALPCSTETYFWPAALVQKLSWETYLADIFVFSYNSWLAGQKSDTYEIRTRALEEYILDAFVETNSRDTP